jgi:hypothetical protein
MWASTIVLKYDTVHITLYVQNGKFQDPLSCHVNLSKMKNPEPEFKSTCLFTDSLHNTSLFS